jgi:hypothetical protein
MAMKRIFGAWTVCLILASAASAQTPAGGEFRVNTYTTNGQVLAGLAMEPDGDFVVAWTSRDQDGDGDGVFGQRFAASGTARGAEFRVNTYTTGWQRGGSVAVGKGGDFVVVWASPQDGSDTGILGQRFDAAGNAIGLAFQINTFTTSGQFGPVVGRASDGSFVVGWSSWYVDGHESGIAARRLDASGNPVGSEMLVNTYTPGTQLLADVAVDPNGNFVVVWERWAGYMPYDGVFAQRYDAEGNRLGSEFVVNSYTTGGQTFGSASMLPDGGFVATWTSYDSHLTGVFARRFDASGNAVGNDFAVNTYTTGYQVSGQVAHDALGNFIVTWTSRAGAGSPPFHSTFARRFSASGAPRGPEFRVNAYTTDLQRAPSVAADSVGNFVVAWNSRQDGSDYGVFAQRFGGLGPAALAVDSPGNRTLEPGETVDVRPSWRNFNGAAQTFSGALTGLTGPSGATYTIVDPAGDYGTVADGATAQCTDCYAVSVSNPPTRPVLHWDASAVESILPDSQGQQKEWRLHIGASFTDVVTNSGFYRFIETLLHHGVTAGCSAHTYCPLASTTREQMAVFLLMAKEGSEYPPPPCTAPVFADVPPSSPFCRWIEELARRGAVAGCGGGNYCPTAPVSREQMSVFVLRTLDPALTPPPCVAGSEIFADVPAASTFCRWIEELARRGIVSGCGGGNYCPTAAVTREQMAVFLGVTFGLSLYGV